MSSEMGMKFRNYTFHAGRLGGLMVRNVSDKDLDWAIQFNRDYIESHSDPRQMVRYQGRYHAVHALPAGVAHRRIQQAQKALECCLLERDHRRSIAECNGEPSPLFNLAPDGQVATVRTAITPPPVQVVATAPGTAQVGYRLEGLVEDLVECLSTFNDKVQAIEALAKELRIGKEA